MSLPTLEQYNEALQSPQLSFSDPELKDGKVRKNGLGLPFAACGGFALTYNVTCASGKYAVRCFHKDSRDLEARYAAISRKLSSLGSRYFVDFQFQSEGIRVHGRPYPLVKMAWADGVTIGEFLEDSFDNGDDLDSLWSSLRSLAAFLEANGIAHGDIQPGNVMVADGGKKVQLIDYDGMYLPELGSLGATETGHRNFQHPSRDAMRPWNSRLDRFSFILLFVAISALRQDPSLWRRFRSDSDRFLFSANDFADPANSAVFTQLATMPQLRDPAARLADICLSGLDSIPSLEDFIGGAAIAGGIDVRKGPADSRYISTYPVLDAHNYEACLAHVGDMVELIGRIEDVKFGRTHFGMPYIFLNFSDWRGKAVKISVWSDYLKKAQHLDFKELKGRHISVIGLLQPPYISSKHGYSHISVNLDTKTPFSVIGESEASYRLGRGKKPATEHGTGQAGRSGEIIIQCPSCAQKLRLPHDGTMIVTCKNCGAAFDYDHGTVRIRPAGSGSSGTEAAGGQRKSNRDIFEEINRTRSTSRSGSDGGNNSKPSGKYVPCPACGYGHSLSIGSSGVTKVRCRSCGREYEYSHYTGKLKELGNASRTSRSAGRKANRDILDDIKGGFSNNAASSGSRQGTDPTRQRNQQQTPPDSWDSWTPLFWIVFSVAAMIFYLAITK